MSEPQSPPKLTVVDPPPGEDPSESRGGLRRAIPWLLLIAALVFAWLWLNQLEATQGLERRVTLLESELAGARDEIAASEAQMEDVRGGIEELAYKLDELRALASDPALAQDAPPALAADDAASSVVPEPPQ